jgi:predicted RNase H-like HicB family nuclease
VVQYKAGYKFVNGGVHAQVLDFPEAITCGADLDEARRMLGMALLDMVETRLELGESLPRPDPAATDPEMDVEEPLYLHLSASSAMCQQPAGMVVP